MGDHGRGVVGERLITLGDVIPLIDVPENEHLSREMAIFTGYPLRYIMKATSIRLNPREKCCAQAKLIIGAALANATSE